MSKNRLSGTKNVILRALENVFGATFFEKVAIILKV
jgi:hypothetical protein